MAERSARRLGAQANCVSCALLPISRARLLQASTEAGPEHDVFIQLMKLKNTLREWMGEAPVTHSEAE